MTIKGRSRRDKILERLREMKQADGHLPCVDGLDFDRDPMSDHTEADELLLRLIADPEITEAFNAIEKWYA